MTQKDRDEFIAYLRNCTDRQVIGVYQKEKDAKRISYIRLAKAEMERRGI